MVEREREPVAGVGYCLKFQLGVRFLTPRRVFGSQVNCVLR